MSRFDQNPLDDIRQRRAWQELELPALPGGALPGGNVQPGMLNVELFETEIIGAATITEWGGPCFVQELAGQSDGATARIVQPVYSVQLRVAKVGNEQVLQFARFFVENREVIRIRDQCEAASLLLGLAELGDGTIVSSVREALSLGFAIGLSMDCVFGVGGGLVRGLTNPQNDALFFLIDQIVIGNLEWVIPRSVDGGPVYGLGTNESVAQFVGSWALCIDGGVAVSPSLGVVYGV